METTDISNLLKKIGDSLAEDKEYPIESTLLHAEVDFNMVGPSIFKNLGNHILYRDPDLDSLTDVLLDLWEAAKPDARWSEVEYWVHDGSFDVKFVYPEEIDPEEDSLDRRTRIVRQYFGDKPIVYPPWPEDDMKGAHFDL